MSLIDESYVQHVRERVPSRPEWLLEVQIVECLKFLSIMSLTQGRRIAVTPEVDDVWHELIVQTRLYEALCASMPGGRFIHHESITPEQYSSRVGDETFVREFVQWVPDYVQSFGQFTELTAAQWTVCGFLKDSLGLSLEEINALGSEPAQAVVPQDSPWSALTGRGSVQGL